MITPESSILKGLETQQLSAVVFIQDYVQLQFDGHCLTAYAWPIIRDGARALSHTTPGYRDALCGLIGYVVEKATEDPLDKLTLYFINGITIEVSLKESDREGPEAAMLQDPTKNRWNVW